MADQGRWFKLWASAPSDGDLQTLSPAERWAWAVFGVYTKVHGTRGRITVMETNTALAAEMGIPTTALIATIKRFPHVCVEESENPSRSITVTWDNWHKYQEDTTMASRAKASRSKKRGEERRREEKKKDSSTVLVQAREILEFLNLKAGRTFRDTPVNLRFIVARLRSGATVENCKGVIARKVREWHGTEYAKYLRPETLFDATKFESYLGERPAEEP